MKIICVGRNYVKHIEELNNVVLKQPAIFMKAETSLMKTNVFRHPEFSGNIHHEVEIVLRFGTEGKNIPEGQALDYIEALSVGIDFTARDIQDELKQKKISWELAKSFDDAAAVGKFLPWKDFSGKDKMSFSLKKNGLEVQAGSSSQMIFDFAAIISFVSRYFTLEEGDLLFTGTPAGVGKVERGDTLEAFLEAEKLLQLKIQ